jgi:hypothetical protein
MNIKFNKDNHEYSVDGVVYPSVTQVINNLGLIDTQWFKPEHAARGSHIHLACQYLDEGCLDYDSLDEEYKPYIDAYKRFLNDCKPEWVGIEQKIFHPIYKYCGTYDRSGMMFGNNITLDIKTGIYHHTHALQLAGYEQTITDDKSSKRYSLYLSRDTTYKLIQHKERMDYKIFNNACSVYWWAKNKGVLK